MTPERMARLVARWVRFYTRDLPASVAQRRIEEVDADLHDHTAHERTHGTSDWRIALSILSRMTRGIAADASWRSQHIQATTDHPPTAGEAMNTSNTAFRSIVRVLLGAGLILLLPLLAMQFTDEVVWGPLDFAIAGTLLVGTGLMYEFAARKAANVAYRAAVGLALGTGLFLVWVILAVGAIGREGDPADLMYFWVLAIGIVGAVIVRFSPEGMARAMVVMAFALGLVAVIALLAGKHQAPGASVAQIAGLNGMFAALFLVSAWLFRRAADRQSPEGATPQG